MHLAWKQSMVSSLLAVESGRDLSKSLFRREHSIVRLPYPSDAVPKCQYTPMGFLCSILVYIRSMNSSGTKPFATLGVFTCRLRSFTLTTNRSNPNQLISTFGSCDSYYNRRSHYQNIRWRLLPRSGLILLCTFFSYTAHRNRQDFPTLMCSVRSGSVFGTEIRKPVPPPRDRWVEGHSMDPKAKKWIHLLYFGGFSLTESIVPTVDHCCFVLFIMGVESSWGSWEPLSLWSVL